MTGSDQKKSKSTITKGIYFGMQIWGLLLFGFIILGYPINLSIGLGFLGGIAGSLVVGWWISPEQPKSVSESQQEHTSRLSQARSRMRSDGFQLTSAIQKRQSRRNGQEGLGLFGRRNKERS
jgi:hypothetical protein